MPIFQPELFQGAKKKRQYFEGWYFKQVNSTGQAWSFIPGISLNHDGSVCKSFIQAIDGSSGTTRWYEFPFEDFQWDKRKLAVTIGKNHFSSQGLHLDLDGDDGRIQGDLEFGSFVPFPAKPWCPGIMGPYSFVPFMECNHGLVSLNHSVDGSIEVDGQHISMSGGRGYIEKDWGKAMPSSWIWTQSNSFSKTGVSLMFSLANIPWLKGQFPGFLCAFSLPEYSRKPQVMATWNGARITSLKAKDAFLTLEIEQKHYHLVLELHRGRGGLLLAPVAGAMERRIAESVDARMHIRFSVAGKLVFEGEAFPAGLEVVGDLSELGADVV